MVLACNRNRILRVITLVILWDSLLLGLPVREWAHLGDHEPNAASTHKHKNTDIATCISPDYDGRLVDCMGAHWEISPDFDHNPSRQAVFSIATIESAWEETSDEEVTDGGSEPTVTELTFFLSPQISRRTSQNQAILVPIPRLRC